VHIPSAGSGRGQHGVAPKYHKSVLNRPGFKFSDTPGPEVGTTADIHSIYII
jgi:hypothetical protein